MINVTDYQKKFEDYFLAKGFVKLDEPVNTEDTFYSAMVPDNYIDFDMNFWDPAVQSVFQVLAEAKTKTFYRLDVYYIDDVLCITASLGDNPRLKIDVSRLKITKQ